MKKLWKQRLSKLVFLSWRACYQSPHRVFSFLARFSALTVFGFCVYLDPIQQDNMEKAFRPFFQGGKNE